VGDQKRVATPDEAVRDGADYIVVGRQVSRAADPAARRSHSQRVGRSRTLDILLTQTSDLEHIDLFLAHYGYFAIFALLMLGIVGPLIPDETILVLLRNRGSSWNSFTSERRSDRRVCRQPLRYTP